MIHNQVSDIYAKAMLKATRADNHDINQTAQLLNDVLDLIINNLNLQLALCAPIFDFTHKLNIIKRLAKKLSLPSNISNFLLILAKNHRFTMLNNIIDRFDSLIKQEKDLLDAEIISAKILPEADFIDIKKTISNKYNKNFIFKQTVDSKLIGGLIIKFDNKILDASIIGVLKKFDIKSQELISIL